MVSRSLTEVFILMRNNAIHSRQIFTEANDSERVGLMRSNSRDLEGGIELKADTSAPPPWTDSLEEAHYVITRLRTKISELQTRHERQIRRPALDDSTEQQYISKLTGEIGRLFTHAHTHLSAIKAQALNGIVYCYCIKYTRNCSSYNIFSICPSLFKGKQLFSYFNYVCMLLLTFLYLY
ncbi:Syntaxin-16 [Papilio machaon]|uniref:Syntaxin-16 n=1 Tax=Papilio machaon TaxID=76193 RepID=A0A0N0PFV0_PAPMA|nr:Syntaxin-16 [Papilio machaon]